MSTRSNIIKVNKNGSVDVIYCQMDGYPEYNGKIILNNYQNQEKVDKLINLGDISKLGKNLEVAPVLAKYGPVAFSYTHYYNSNDLIDYTLAYHRDNNESLNILHYKNLDEYFKDVDVMIAYAYIYIDNKWYITRPKERGKGWIKPKLLKSVLNQVVQTV